MAHFFARSRCNLVDAFVLLTQPCMGCAIIHIYSATLWMFRLTLCRYFTYIRGPNFD